MIKLYIPSTFVSTLNVSGSTTLGKAPLSNTTFINIRMTVSGVTTLNTTTNINAALKYTA